MFKAINIKRFFLCVLLTEAVGVASWLVTQDSASQYGGFIKPAMALPVGAFAWIWGIVLLLAGAALYIVRESSSGRHKGTGAAVTFFYVTLFFTFLRPILLFGFGLHGFTVIWMIALVILLVINIKQFFGRHRAAGVMMIPCFLWALYLIYLYYGIWSMN